ncbi:SPOR domain-containing protein [Sulfurimonas sp. SAG-AH-194-I05]|nr:SPOR domain-containing protein [Sulfurimonas sp. SAG-AH-194-I05]MDF1875820.1 SPOR domain-containing protein [Sulfurimonas sp. SAG-AH-194-I05]
MQESNELNDIILNKGSATNNNKKIILAVATLGVILIIVIMLMSSLTSNGTSNLPQTPIPPQPQTQDSQLIEEESLFEEVEVLEEDDAVNENLDAIAKRLKEESLEEELIIQSAPTPVVSKPTPRPVVKQRPKPIVKKPVTRKPVVPSSSGVNYYIQVGSFSKYAPNKKFLANITRLGYTYEFHKVTRNSKVLNKVLVGPFKSSSKAKDAKRVLRAKVEPGAFLIKM